MSTDSVLFLGIFCAQKEEPEKDKDEMACRREEGSEARLLAVVHVDARSACGGATDDGGVWSWIAS